MGWRVQKHFRLGGPFRINLSKSGIGISTGIRGLRYSIGPRGARATVSLPGTGISYVATSGHRRRRAAKTSGTGCLGLVGILIAISLVVSFVQAVTNWANSVGFLGWAAVYLALAVPILLVLVGGWLALMDRGRSGDTSSSTQMAHGFSASELKYINLRQEQFGNVMKVVKDLQGVFQAGQHRDPRVVVHDDRGGHLNVDVGPIRSVACVLHEPVVVPMRMRTMDSHVTSAADHLSGAFDAFARVSLDEAWAAVGEALDEIALAETTIDNIIANAA